MAMAVPYVVGRKAALLGALANALVSMIRGARGRRVTISANSIARRVGYRGHGELLLIGRALSSLARKKIVRAELKRGGRGRAFKYVVEDWMELWAMARSRPEEARRYILSAMSDSQR